MSYQFLDTKEVARSLQPLVNVIETLGTKNFPFARKACKRAAYHVMDFWVQSAQGNPIPGTGRRINNEAYARSIDVFPMSDFKYVVGSYDEKLHGYIEGGREHPYDFKAHLREFDKTQFRKTDAKNGRGKKGDPYLVVPFRHKEKTLKKAKRRSVESGRMKSVYKMINGPVKSKITSNDPVQKQRTYKWASRVEPFEKQVKKGNKADRYSGMVRFETSTGKGSSSAYMTFRVCSVNSPAQSWIIPARPGIPITELVQQSTERTVLEMISQGILADFQVLGVLK